MLFITGTRADFSKIKPLIASAMTLDCIEVDIFVTGMHMLREYGLTYLEVEEIDAPIFRFINHVPGDSDYATMSKTLLGLGDYVSQAEIDLIVVHGDRMEAVAGSLVGVMTNTLVAHIEGGELSGTVDESYRHSITKLAHIHLVSNDEARSRLLQLGEGEDSVHVIGSPELDLMHSKSLPKLDSVKTRYGIPFETYGIAIFHPVVTERDNSHKYASAFAQALVDSGMNWVILESNNDQGSEGVREVMKTLRGHDRFRVLPSMRYEFFLTLLRESQLIAGNSSTGVREAPHYGIPSVNVGSRQSGRTTSPLVVNTPNDADSILDAFQQAIDIPRFPDQRFGDGKSSIRFANLLADPAFFERNLQKHFIDRTGNK